MKQTTKIHIPIYGDYLHIFIGSRKQYLAYVLKCYNVDLSGDIRELTDGAATFISPHIYSLWLAHYHNTIASMGTLVHECLHIAIKVLEHRSIYMSAEEDEALAYLQEWLFETAFNWIENCR